jgi:hypothetical protein
MLTVVQTAFLIIVMSSWRKRVMVVDWLLLLDTNDRMKKLLC